MGFQQAAIRVEKAAEFALLKGAIERAFDPGIVERFLKRLRSYGLRVRDLDAVLRKGVLDEGDRDLARSGNTSQGLYQSLTVSDQAQMREFYLSKVEEVEAPLRHKFRNLYQYG